MRGDRVILTRHKVETEPTYGGWDSYDTFSEAQQKEFEKWYKSKYAAPRAAMREPAESVYQAPEGYDDHLDHHTNFVNAIRNGTTPVEDAVFGLRAAAPSLAANMSLFEGKIIRWDPVNMVLE
ncbi:MAG: hypothetical protein AAB316_05010 [Bacteroidota bacterium]